MISFVVVVVVAEFHTIKKGRRGEVSCIQLFFSTNQGQFLSSTKI